MPQKECSRRWRISTHVSPEPGSIILVCWASVVTGSGRVFYTWSLLVKGNAWIRQLRRRCSGKYNDVFSLRSVMVKASKAISCFLPTMLGGRHRSSSFGMHRRVISVGILITREMITS